MMIKFRVKKGGGSVSLSRASLVEGFTESVKLPVRGPRLARYVLVPAAYEAEAEADKGLVRVKA